MRVLMNLVLETPTRLRLPASLSARALQELQDYLGYTDLRVGHQLRQWKDARRQGDRHWFVQKYGEEALEDKIRELEVLQSKTLLFRDERGYWTYSGLAGHMMLRLGARQVERAYTLPAPQEVDWATPPPYEARPYQEVAALLMLDAAHGGVELATGLGKSFIMALMLKKLGLSGVIVAPYLNIAEQLLADMRERFGKQSVGQFFGGKKQPERKIVVAVSKSLLNCAPGDQNWTALAQKHVVVGDESHLLPADTLSDVILGMLGQIPYRFFLSGTQIRTDGLDLLLNGITGSIYHRMTVRQGVEGGYLTPQKFFSFQVRSDSTYNNRKDPIKMNREHLHANDNVYAHAGRFINAGVAKGRRCLVLVEELHQFTRLLPHLRYDVRFAHGGVSKKNKRDIPARYHKANPRQLVGAFDAGEFPILVGTSCIGTGTDIKSPTMAVDLVGGKAETRVRQNVGRCTRLFPGKTDCIYADYDIYNVPMLHKQAEARKKIHEDIYGPVTVRRA